MFIDHDHTMINTLIPTSGPEWRTRVLIQARYTVIELIERDVTQNMLILQANEQQQWIKTKIDEAIKISQANSNKLKTKI
jgi:hypothetical protein